MRDVMPEQRGRIDPKLYEKCNLRRDVTTGTLILGVSYAVRFRASDLYFSISKIDDPAYAVQICKIRPEQNRFENPMTEVVGLWAKIRRLGSSDCQIDKWHAF